VENLGHLARQLVYEEGRVIFYKWGKSSSAKTYAITKESKPKFRKYFSNGLNLPTRKLTKQTSSKLCMSRVELTVCAGLENPHVFLVDSNKMVDDPASYFFRKLVQSEPKNLYSYKYSVK